MEGVGACGASMRPRSPSFAVTGSSESNVFMAKIKKIASLKHSLKALGTAYVVVFTARQALILIVQYLYVKKSQFIKEFGQELERDELGKRRLVEEQEQLYRWLIFAGANYRSLGAAAIPCYGIYAFLPILYYLLVKFLLNRHDHLKNFTLYVFLNEPKQCYTRTTSRIEDCIQRVLESNKNYLSSSSQSSSSSLEKIGLNSPDKGSSSSGDELNNLIVGPRLPLLSQNRLDTLKARRNSTITFLRLKPPLPLMSPPPSPPPPPAQQKQHRRNSTRKRSKQLASSKLDYLGGLMNKEVFQATCRQRNHLLQLLRDKKRLWPVNRDEQWRQQLGYFWLRVYLFFSMFIFIGSQVASQLAQWLCTSLMQEKLNLKPTEHLGLLSKELNQMFLMDRLSMIEQSLFVWAGCHYFVVPVSIMVAAVHDQMHFLATLNGRFELFFNKLNKIRLQHRPGDPIDSNLVAQLRFSCDRDALEIYILMQYFRFELKDNLSLMAIILSQYASFIVLLLLCSLGVITLIDPQHLYLLGILLILCLITTNCIFYIAADFNAQCVRCSNLAWSLIATSRLSCRRLASTQSSQEEVQPLAIEHLVTPHTLMLWNRLVGDQRQLIEQMACKVLGYFRMDYANQIRFNLWLVSIVMLMLTGSSQICHLTKRG